MPPPLVPEVRTMSEANASRFDIDALSGRGLAVGIVVAAFAVLAALGIAFPESAAGGLLTILTSRGMLSATLRSSVPIAFAALGGIFAEKSGVVNIGLEGLLIISAFGAIYFTDVLGSLWLGVVMAIIASTVLAGIFAVVCIEFRADQIIAGLAVWLIALGLAPFASQVFYGSTNSKHVASVQSIPNMGIPGISGLFGSLAQIPFFGALFSASPFVYLMFVAVALSWWVLNRTAFGRHVRASGENPQALDTAGVNVHRVRYTAVLLSGVLCGVGGAALSLSLGQFVGNGPTMVNGRGFIAIVAYLFGNYNPVGAFLSTLLFGGLDALQTYLQTTGIFHVPKQLTRTIPYITVIIVLALFGRTRIPEAAGEHFESGEE